MPECLVPESLTGLELERTRLLEQFLRFGDFRPGSITASLRRCGNPTRNPSENRRFGAEVSARDWMVYCAPRIHYPAPNTAPKSGFAFRRTNRAQKVERAARKTLVGCTEAWAAVAAAF